MNFPLILLVLTLLSGGLSLIDRLFFAKNRPVSEKMPKVFEYSYSFFPVLFAVLVVRSFLGEPFRIPSSSLEPTLLIGDFVLVNKFTYGLRLPVFETKIVSVNNPKTGQIAVFRWPPNPSFDYIKRVIGQPGDTVAYHNKQLSINGVVMKQTFIEYTVDPHSGQTVALYEENLKGIKHEIYLRPDVEATDFEVKIPPHAYFMMGDNRDDSADSRYWGVVDDRFLRGQAFMTWMSVDWKNFSIRFNRIGKFIN